MTVALAGALGLSAGLVHCSSLQHAVRRRLEYQVEGWRFAANAHARVLFVASLLAFAASMGAAAVAASAVGYWIARSAWLWRSAGDRSHA